MMENKFIGTVFVFLLIAILGCSDNNGKKKNDSDSIDHRSAPLIPVSAGVKENSDTTLFFPRKNNVIKLLVLDDNGSLVLNKSKMSVKLIGTGENLYDLSVSKSGQEIFSKKGIQGISKILCTEDVLMFSIYSLFTEDGANEGEGVMIHVSNSRVNVFKRTLGNTCNPVVWKDKVYFLDGLLLIEADMDLNQKRSLPISYKDDSGLYGYLDSYLICGLTVAKDKSQLLIEFTPEKGNKACSFFGGEINPTDEVILLSTSELKNRN